MLRLALVFLVISIVAAIFGFGNASGAAMQGAKLLFAVFLVLAVVMFIVNLLNGNRGSDLI